ncbi:calcium uniporter regulatory subunit MCUb, mitochondrial [Octodon degus]|uniref:Calcium uniporter protein n=1 Tax=Octodon degus TaxID=10160 RepID=A0A6P6E0P7_OCTDE|nr:calcium uniporter regulatory subunit MCUb, mitochondrial [Octodon degus]XP_023565831.1 calcium uniporter regulatory subunit MCUb, mitochondrial [Octodon degus]
MHTCGPGGASGHPPVSAFPPSRPRRCPHPAVQGAGGAGGPSDRARPRWLVWTRPRSRPLLFGSCAGPDRMLARGRLRLPATPRAQVQVWCVRLYGNLSHPPSHLSSTVVPSDEVTVNYRHGLPLITLTLPSRKERCRFVVKPMLSTVGSFLQDLHREDKGVKTAAIFTADGSEIPASTLMDVLLMKEFKLIINEIAYVVQCPEPEKPSREYTTEMEQVRSLVHRLFAILYLEELQKETERRLLVRIDHLQAQLQPLEQVKARIEAHAEASTSRLLWAGLALLSAQGGALAWLTWWVYSWDLMEPVTCFLTFANSMVFFAYFIVTRQNCTYPAARSRQFLHFFHKKSWQQHFDVEQYNKLKDELAKAEESLKLLRRSLCLGLRVEQLKEEN